MNLITPATRVAFIMMISGVSILLIGHQLGMFPNEQSAKIRGRVSLCESVAVECSLLASLGAEKPLEQGLRAVLERNSDVISVGLRRVDNQLALEIGPHASQWKIDATEPGEFMKVPILKGDRPWGQIEVHFAPLGELPWIPGLDNQFLRFIAFFSAACLLIYLFYLARVFGYLDPTRSVPARVRTTLDTLAEGLLLLDRDQNIVLANQAFLKLTGASSEDIVGKPVSDLPWQPYGDGVAPVVWESKEATGDQLLNGMLTYAPDQQAPRILKVNSANVCDDAGEIRGALATFDDVTALESKKNELLQMLEALRDSREEIRRQNEELQVLATRDPLTGCYNRRTFFEQFERHWKDATGCRGALACMIVDIDFFKSINDNHGHSMGDEVLRQVGATLNKELGGFGVVCRYGGEEFCVLLPDMELDTAFVAGEQARNALGKLVFSFGKITASLGVSSIRFGAETSLALLEQSDKALYFAKRSGRNRTIIFPDVPNDLTIDSKKLSRTKPVENQIPYPAVTALLSALSYRDAETAAHSYRVAELASMLATKFLPATETYFIEIASLLHDIGKIGVPDAILLKPGALTAEEWKTMELHDRIGVEVINSAFQCSALTNIVGNHHALFGGDPSKPHLPSGDNIPLGARILSICDAYDAMVSDRVYRKGKSKDFAIGELRRCAGRQFDPQLVESFIEMVSHISSENPTRRMAVSKEIALQIGQEIERIARAVDEQDLSGLAALVGHLQATAEHNQLKPIADIARQLTDLVKEEPELSEVVATTQELLSLCRATQSALLQPSCGIPVTSE